VRDTSTITPISYFQLAVGRENTPFSLLKLGTGLFFINGPSGIISVTSIKPYSEKRVEGELDYLIMCGLETT
jgi:hypothetical protein